MSKVFKLTIEQDEGGIIHTEGVNNGFSAFELIGILEIRKLDIIKQVVNHEKFKHTRVAKVDDEYIAIEEKEDSEDDEK